MVSGFRKYDPVFGSVDLDDEYITDAWLVDQYVGTTLFSCGYNTQGGGLGINNTINYSSPVQVGALTNWDRISVNTKSNIFLATKTDGTLWACGYNSTGQIGLSTTVKYSSPVQVGSLTNWKTVSCGYRSVAAIKTDGTLWTWGGNSTGSLGVGNLTGYSSPIQVGSSTNWKIVESDRHGSAILVAIKADGTLWACGYNAKGTLGINNTINYSSPVQVGSSTDWKQISVGGNTVAAIKTDGTLWTWGSNSNGKLGINDAVTNYSSPVQIGSLTNWKTVSCGSSWISAIKTDGTLWSWGGNTYGQFGMGNIINYSSPVQIGSLTNWKTVSCGYRQSAFIKTDGTLWACGYNNRGQLSVNNRINYSSPIQVGGLSNWKSVEISNQLVGIFYNTL